MNRITPAILCCVLFMALSCEQEGTPKKQVADTSSTSQGATTTPVPKNLDSLFSVIGAIEDSLFRTPKDTTLFRTFLRASFDSVSGCFYVVGKGLAKRARAASIRDAERRKAAQRTAERWALYAKAWQEGQSLSFGHTISGTITYSTQAGEREKNDTLLMMIQVPLGSIVLRP
jgi:hypothetical protein